MTQGGLADGLFTNRTFLGGVGSVPTTTPTSFGGESSLILIPPILGRGPSGRRVFTLRGVLGLGEAIVKGLLARGLHFAGLSPGRLAGEGELAFLQPARQVALKEGGEVRIEYSTEDGRPRAVPIQISGDPFQAQTFGARVFWGPVPLLAAADSLLLSSTRRTLTHLRLQQSFGLKPAYIGGVHYFRHEAGVIGREAIETRTGLVAPPLYLPLELGVARDRLCQAWKRLDTGEFIDTSEPGRKLRKKTAYCHNNDQSAHLLLMRESRGRILVRQVRRAGPQGRDIFEARTSYRLEWGSYVIDHGQILHWRRAGPGRILQEERFFRDKAEFRVEAPTYFPVLSPTPGAPTLPVSWDDEPEVSEDTETISRNPLSTPKPE